MQKSWDLRERTMDFAVAGFKFCRSVPVTPESSDVIRQLRKSLSSVAANYRATRRAQTDRTFVAKLAVVIEEADEAGFWMDFLVQLGVVNRTAVAALARESNELIAIFTASKKTVEARLEKARKARSARRESVAGC